MSTTAEDKERVADANDKPDILKDCCMPTDGTQTSEQRTLSERLDGVGWGLFIVWVGIALLLDVGIGVGLLGVGAITLGEQALRVLFGLKLEGFWSIVGVLLCLGGLWELFQFTLPFMPLVLVAIGVVILISAMTKRPSAKND